MDSTKQALGQRHEQAHSAVALCQAHVGDLGEVLLCCIAMSALQTRAIPARRALAGKLSFLAGKHNSMHSKT